MIPTLTPVRRHKKWGFANEKGHIIIPCNYDDVGNFYVFGYVAPVRRGCAWWFITHKNKVASTFTYDRVESYYWHRYLVQRDGFWGFVNDFGQEVVRCQYQDVRPVDAESRLVFGMVETPVCRNGKWGIINDKGQEVLACDYAEIRTIYNGQAEVKIGKTWVWITFDLYT